MKNEGYLRDAVFTGVVQDSRMNETSSLYDGNTDLPQEEKRARKTAHQLLNASLQLTFLLAKASHVTLTAVKVVGKCNLYGGGGEQEIAAAHPYI